MVNQSQKHYCKLVKVSGSHRASHQSLHRTRIQGHSTNKHYAQWAERWLGNYNTSMLKQEHHDIPWHSSHCALCHPLWHSLEEEMPTCMQFCHLFCIALTFISPIVAADDGNSLLFWACDVGVLRYSGSWSLQYPRDFLSCMQHMQLCLPSSRPNRSNMASNPSWEWWNLGDLALPKPIQLDVLGLDPTMIQQKQRCQDQQLHMWNWIILWLLN